MIFWFDLFIVVVTSLITIQSIKGLLTNKGSMLDYCLLAFYALHVVPLIVQLNEGVPDTLSHKNVQLAMDDKTTDVIYGLSVWFVIWLLRRLSKKLLKYKIETSPATRGYIQQLLGYIMFIFMLAPLIAVIFAPSPQIYLNFSYFYTHSYSEFSDITIYHRSAVAYSMYLSLLGVCFKYYTRKDDRLNYMYYMVIIMDTWIDGKRTILLFLMIGILASDLIKGNYSNELTKKKQLFKTLLFLSIIFLYFNIYNDRTGKGTDANFYYLYTFYFSRMSIVKTAIYDQLYTNNILEYPLQTIIFNLFVWIPRAVWPDKPLMYCIYFTSYADATTSLLPFNLQVNVWSEFVSNMGLFGFVVAVLFYYYIAKKSLQSNSSFIYLLGTIFTILYCMYGFEHIVMTIFYFWLVLIAKQKIGKRRKLKKG